MSSSGLFKSSIQSRFSFFGFGILAASEDFAFFDFFAFFFGSSIRSMYFSISVLKLTSLALWSGALRNSSISLMKVS